MNNNKQLSFFEATGIIVGHGVGAGILSVPFLASHNSILTIVFIILICLAYNFLLHLLIAELSLNNDGAQFVSCIDRELFTGKLKKILTWLAFGLIGLSVLFNVTAFLTGAAAVFRSWFGLPDWLGMILFYVIGASVVFFGLKIVGVCEKYAVTGMIVVVAILFIRSLIGDTQPMPTGFRGFNNALALFGMVSFSLSAVMSTPQVVKGLDGDAKKIKLSIMTGLCITALLIFFVTLTTLLGAGKGISEDGAIVDLAKSFGGWVSIVGYLFTLLALATSFWANTLNLRDIIHEQTKWGQNISWLVSSLPCLILAFMNLSSFVGLSRFASIIQVITGLGIIVAYGLSRKRVGHSLILGKFGTLPFQILCALCSILATVGAVLPVK